MREGLSKIVPTDDTIVAISTPLGRSGIGVVRMSGRGAQSVASKFLKSTLPLVHCQATRGVWTDENGATLDEVVVTLFKRPNSYTGEDVLEISAHGNPLVLGRMVECIRGYGVRIASPGEFTFRAVLNGKMDLIQAEAVRNFIDAQTDAQARTALLQMGGALSNGIRPVKEQLIDLIAHLEAGIDFADDEVHAPPERALAVRMHQVMSGLLELQRSYSYGKLLMIGLRLAIVGKPNVGKSSLFNRFVGMERAIVTDIPGTTRDVLAESISMDGVPLRFFDTAGLREAADPVEKIGVVRTLETLSEADLVIVVLDGSAEFDDSDRKILARVDGAAHIVVINKCDLPRVNEGAPVLMPEAIHVSATTGMGLDELRQAVRRFISSRGESIADSILTTARQAECVGGAIRALDKGRMALMEGTPHEMVLLDIYEALTKLNELTGEVVTDDILGRIFSSFCVGK